jgi:hypothetical protein
MQNTITHTWHPTDVQNKGVRNILPQTSRHQYLVDTNASRRTSVRHKRGEWAWENGRRITTAPPHQREHRLMDPCTAQTRKPKECKCECEHVNSPNVHNDLKLRFILHHSAKVSAMMIKLWLTTRGYPAATTHLHTTITSNIPRPSDWNSIKCNTSDRPSLGASANTAEHGELIGRNG